MAQTFPNLGNDTHLQIQEAQQIQDRKNLKLIMPKNITSKLLKIKKKRKNLRSRQRQTTLYREEE